MLGPIKMSIAFALALVSPHAVAQNATDSIAQVEIILDNFSYGPEEISLKAGHPVTLRLVNRGSGGHDFSAPEFFKAAKVDAGSATAIKGGTVEVAKGASVSIRLVPASGEYKLRCTHFLHSSFGMKGRIIVK